MLLTTAYYILEGQTPVPVADALMWARWLMGTEPQVAWTAVTEEVCVSTIFRGVDHYHCSGSPPLLFETAICGLVTEGNYLRRYATWAEAEAGHAHAVAIAQQLVIPSACLPGSLCEQCFDAPATRVRPAPWGGDMGVCLACAPHDPMPPAWCLQSAVFLTIIKSLTFSAAAPRLSQGTLACAFSLGRRC